MRYYERRRIWKDCCIMQLCTIRTGTCNRVYGTPYHTLAVCILHPHNLRIKRYTLFEKLHLSADRQHTYRRSTLGNQLHTNIYNWKNSWRFISSKMEVSDNVNADLNSFSVTTKTFESMEVDEVLIYHHHHQTYMIINSNQRFKLYIFDWKHLRYHLSSGYICIVKVFFKTIFILYI